MNGNNDEPQLTTNELVALLGMIVLVVIVVLYRPEVLGSLPMILTPLLEVAFGKRKKDD